MLPRTEQGGPAVWRVHVKLLRTFGKKLVTGVLRGGQELGGAVGLCVMRRNEFPNVRGQLTVKLVKGLLENYLKRSDAFINLSK